MNEGFPASEGPELFKHLGTEVRPLAEFILDRPSLSSAELLTIAEQATTLLSGIYVHLPVKRALYAIDPLARLGALRNRLTEGDPDLTEDDFHAEMTAIFSSLRDCHTNYFLPRPYRDHIAFLPFLIERCHDPKTPDAGPSYLVSRVAKEVARKDFPDPRASGHTPRMVVTHWNGMEIHRAVEANGVLNAGGNASARHARGLNRLTVRWLGMATRPPEDWVILTYKLRGKARELKFPWLVVKRPTGRRNHRTRRPRTTIGVDREVEWRRRVRYDLFAADDTDRAAGRFRQRTVSRKREPDIGYLRIFTFSVDTEAQVERFLRDTRRLLAQAPPDGLIIDIRGNPGGDIRVAEGLLQMLAPVPIERESLQFINTPPAVPFAERLLAAEGLEDSFDEFKQEGSASGAPYIASPPLEPKAGYEAVDQAYQGPLALIVDGLSYSAADVFAAGFQDHDLGLLLGTAESSGGGGGNLLDYEEVRGYADGLKQLPAGASFDVAIRRTTRVRRRAGLGLEDLGVVVPYPTQYVYRLTPKDVLGDNDDLIESARRMLSQELKSSLSATLQTDPPAFAITAEGVSRVDVLVNDRPIDSLTLPERVAPLKHGLEGIESALFLGYDDRPRRRDRREPAVAYRWRPP